MKVRDEGLAGESFSTKVRDEGPTGEGFSTMVQDKDVEQKSRMEV